MFRHARTHTGAGAFSAMLALVIPWQLAEAFGVSEERAALLGAGVLTLAALAALWAARLPRMERSIPLPAFRDTFELRTYLRRFAAYALALLTTYAGIWWFTSAFGP